jgi:3D (Asp-Asp-Asp) domain-containing protein
MKIWLKILVIFSLILIGIVFEFPLEAENFDQLSTEGFEQIVIFQENSIFGISNPNNPEKEPIRILAIVTAYSSTPWETDEDPHITASGKPVRDGVVANNFWPFGTKIKIPEIFGDKIFVVEDRMSCEKGNYQFDVWFENYFEALKFGAQKTFVEILPY